MKYWHFSIFCIRKRCQDIERKDQLHPWRQCWSNCSTEIPKSCNLQLPKVCRKITFAITEISKMWYILIFSYSRRKVKQFYPNFHSKELMNLYDTESRNYNEEAFRNANPNFNLTEFKIKAASPPTIVAATLSKIDLATSFTDKLTPFGVCKSLDLGK